MLRVKWRLVITREYGDFEKTYLEVLDNHAPMKKKTFCTCVRACAHVRAHVHALVRALVCARVRACVCANHAPYISKEKPI